MLAAIWAKASGATDHHAVTMFDKFSGACTHVFMAGEPRCRKETLGRLAADRRQESIALWGASFADTHGFSDAPRSRIEELAIRCV